MIHVIYVIVCDLMNVVVQTFASSSSTTLVLQSSVAVVHDVDVDVNK